MDKSYNEKLSIVRELVILSNIDNEQANIEIAFIKEIAVKLGISDKDFDYILNNDLPLDVSENEFERIYYFQSIVMLMCIDQKIDEREVDFCKQIGLKFGLNTKAVATILERMIADPTKPIPPQELIKIYKLYHS